MRPYKIVVDDEHIPVWIDLDHILALKEPYFINRSSSEGGYRARFEITMAFKNEPMVFATRSAMEKKDEGMHLGRWDFIPVVVMKEGIPEGVWRLNQVFKALHDAWTNKS